ncbi:hypothetical protein COW36_12430 [bacterium (Candidatus Blackallbacteria) CG17_big_fil_post_rev_8_21_14_2_50_48_46]|uniref:Sialidase domain-containing protein n=1 Tax=bacterium (Candidatus Blackallbacteria) CG17_big_fil_post_rev_8_21_14_2_50_48_46 TaxID=2014261 RepID=A0A2M7G416_9BACT|nr:MAG: hypothetical protein COW64_02830 [bacterium (Candidatus Blackallbacteria) CG18_big_fil_WC_8_21_14_2_50_49_26]PIW16567.1 MAG: hypothetical protein COW36_12430 [bacterium (Candidatus Blackallbacteria) CG17_big_fil_post_rev_8_21_14_2_50_48_46]PIW46075.1 MAG: hypothetical protein COW20_17695 [bacterium (Candidatus Blackallbacteria) CG13_big_fil_rev_8_21_14_2_50_49_14]
MKNKRNQITGLLIAVSVSLASVLSCQTLPTTGNHQATLNQSVLQLNTETAGSIRLHIDLPMAKSYPALAAYHGFSTQSIEEGRINRIKVTITSVSTDFKAEKIIPISQGGMTATIKVPLGRNYLLKVQGMDDLDEVPGALVKGVFTVESSEVTPDVDVNLLTTMIATIIEQVSAQDKVAAAAVDSEKLKALVLEGKSAANPALVNAAAFSAALVTGKGVVPSIVPVNPVLKPGNISGSISGLMPGDAAVVLCNDPVSSPVIVVAPPQTTSGALAPTTVSFRIDNIPAGSWTTRVIASGYQVQGDSIASTNELSAAKTVVVSSNTQASISFGVSKVTWSATPINASGNIGSSDQPDAEVDGSDNIHMVWRQDGFQEEKESGMIFYSRYNGKTWSTDNRNVSTQPSGFVSISGDDKFRGARNPAVAVGVDRSPHVLWSSNSDNKDFKGRRIVYSHFDGVNWSKPLIISVNSPTTEVEADFPDIAVNPINGQVYAVWSQLENSVKTVYLSQLQDGKWQAPIQLSNQNTQSYRPRINIGTNGIMHVVWEIEDTARVQYISWDGKQFLPIEEVPFTQDATGKLPRSLDARVDLLNRLHLVRRSESTIQYLYRSNNSWSRSEAVHEIGNITVPVLSNASVYLDNIGNVNVVWTSALSNGTPILRFRRRTNEGWERTPGSSAITVPSATATPSAFPSPTPEPTGTPAPTPAPVTQATPFQGFDDLPASENKIPTEKPLVLIDSRGKISVIWSNNATDPVNSEIYHSLKTGT